MTDYNKAEQYLIGYLKSKGMAIRGSEVKDFGLDGDEDKATIEGYADDYLSDIDTERAEYAATAQERYNEHHEQDVFNRESGQHFGSGYSEEGLVRQWAKNEGIDGGIIE